MSVRTIGSSKDVDVAAGGRIYYVGSLNDYGTTRAKTASYEGVAQFLGLPRELAVFFLQVGIRGLEQLLPFAFCSAIPIGRCGAGLGETGLPWNVRRDTSERCWLSTFSPSNPR